MKIKWRTREKSIFGKENKFFLYKDVICFKLLPKSMDIVANKYNATNIGGQLLRFENDESVEKFACHIEIEENSRKKGKMKDACQIFELNGKFYYKLISYFITDKYNAVSENGELAFISPDETVNLFTCTMVEDSI